MNSLVLAACWHKPCQWLALAGMNPSWSKHVILWVQSQMPDFVVTVGNKFDTNLFPLVCKACLHDSALQEAESNIHRMMPSYRLSL